MKTKQFLLLAATLIALLATGNAQEKLEKNKQYTGAQATQPAYKAVYQMDQASPEIIKKTIRNINNLLKDPRLQGKVQVELVAFSGGTEAYKKNSGFEQGLKELIDQGVIVVQCLNTLKERNISKSELYDFIGYVPTGNGELVIRAAEGWTIIKP
ncbi:MAG: DsrE family protein [Agriterribacter sp.]